MLKTTRARILAVCTAIIVLSLIINTFLNYQVAGKYNDKSIDNMLSAVTESHSLAIGDWVASKKQMMASLYDVAAGSDDPVPIFRQITRSGDFINVYMGYANGTAKFVETGGIPADYNPTVRPWYQQAVKEGEPLVTAPYVDMVTNTIVVSFVAPVIDNGTLIGVVGSDMAMKNVIANVNAIHPTTESYGLLIQADGTIIAHPNPELTMKPLKEIAPEVALDRILSAKTPVEVKLSGVDKLVLARPVAGTDWYVLVALDKAQATAGMHSLLLTSVITLVVIALLGSLIVSVMVNSSLRRLLQVRDAMDDISNGTNDLTQRLPDEGHDEVAQIARSFNRFVDKLSMIMLQIRDVSASLTRLPRAITTCPLVPKPLRRACSKRRRRWNRFRRRSLSRRGRPSMSMSAH